MRVASDSTIYMVKTKVSEYLNSGQHKGTSAIYFLSPQTPRLPLKKKTDIPKSQYATTMATISSFSTNQASQISGSFSDLQNLIAMDGAERVAAGTNPDLNIVAMPNEILIQVCSSEFESIIN